jgi:hypothetical protein
MEDGHGFEDETSDQSNVVEASQKTNRYMPPSSVGFSFFIRGDQIEFQVQYFAVRYESGKEPSEKGRYLSQNWQRISLSSDDDHVGNYAIHGALKGNESKETLKFRDSVLQGHAELDVLFRPFADGWIVTVSLCNSSCVSLDGGAEEWNNALSGHINVDDTGARHDGANGYCTHIGNEYFAWFKSTKSKSRINFLKLLHSGHDDFVINEDALEYMQSHKLPEFQLEKLRPLKEKQFKTEEQWKEFLKHSKIKSKNHIRIATEGGLVGSIIHHGYNKDMVIISDDAGQFNVTDIWNLYRELKKL